MSSDASEAIARLTTAEVLSLLRISRATLWRRIAAEQLPRPVDHGRQALFSKSAVLEAASRSDARLRSYSVATEVRLEQLRRRKRVVHSFLRSTR